MSDSEKITKPNIGQIERQTQNRIVNLFTQKLGYGYLGNWQDRKGNAPIEFSLLEKWLTAQGVSSHLISRALHELKKQSSDPSKSLYDLNKTIHRLLRYGIKLKPGAGETTETVWLVDWKNPEKNSFALAEEVTVEAQDSRAHTKRPDIVLYVNGLALGILELKRSTVSVSEGIRQNLDNQKKEFIRPFFTTLQWIMAGNDTEGLRYGTIETPEKYYLQWFEETGLYEEVTNPLDHHVLQICQKSRFLELIHDFIIYDSGTKKVSRQNQYFGVKAAQDFIRRREGGILWHTQGSGKSLTMVWLAKWIRENLPSSRVLIITDRTELDEQIQKVFTGVDENIYRTASGSDLLDQLNHTSESLLCTLVHKFTGREKGSEETGQGDFLRSLRNLPPGFKAKGDLYVFVDECHRTQSGELNKAMRALLPHALFIGFTGTPLLRDDKARSVEIFGRYIHTYKFDQAVREGVVLDMRYEARDVDQSITSQGKIDNWFDAKTKGLNDLAKSQLKKKWGTMQRVLSSQSRLEKIVADILMDMNIKPRLMDLRGNAMLVAGSIYEACRFYELFAATELQGKCAIVTSYSPNIADTKGETTGEGETDILTKYKIYQKMLADWFDQEPEKALSRAEEFEKEVKKKFIEEPGQMRLLIVVDKLLTGFDAPSATYLYIDKQMRDHGLFQAICRVNRLDGDSKDYGYIVDYKDLFKSLVGAVKDYTSGALDAYDREDVQGLLKDRLKEARKDLENSREQVKALCEGVEPPQDTPAYLKYFCAQDSGNADQLKENEPKRLQLYHLVSALIRIYANIASELSQAGYSETQIATIKQEVDHFSKVRDEVKLASGDFIDMKLYEPAMRHLIDTYIRAEESEKISSFDDQSLIDLIIQKGPAVVEDLPESISKSQEAVAETIENNVRKLIINEKPVDPAYYDKMSALLDALIEERRKGMLEYKEYLSKIVQITKDAKNPGGPNPYPESLKTAAQRVLYHNLGNDAALALKIHEAVMTSRQDEFRGNPMKLKKIRNAIRAALFQNCQESRDRDPEAVNEEACDEFIMESTTNRLMDIIIHQHEY